MRSRRARPERMSMSRIRPGAIGCASPAPTRASRFAEWHPSCMSYGGFEFPVPRPAEGNHLVGEGLWLERRSKSKTRSPSCTPIGSGKISRPWTHLKHQRQALPGSSRRSPRLISTGLPAPANARDSGTDTLTPKFTVRAGGVRTRITELRCLSLNFGPPF
jgi:hypothetical protein